MNTKNNNRVWVGCMLFSMMIMVIAGCQQIVEDDNENWDIGSQEYADMAEQAMMHLQDFDYDAWGEMLADDIEYYFPDGDAGTRTALTGKTAVLDWWRNWENTSGITSMTFSNPVFLPVIAQVAPNYAGLTGPYVVSYMSNKMDYSGTVVNLRMNFTVHFNEDNKIDRYYSYYDRSLIINAMGTNILSTSDMEEN